MAICKLNDGSIIGDYLKPYVVAEVNSSHNGNVETAQRMIDAAKAAGCDCVKFQSWSAESLYSKTYYDANPISKRIVKKFALTKEQLLLLSAYCRSKGVAFSSTPYSKEEVDFLADKCSVPYIKIASMDINNLSFIDYIARKNLPIILSTGMSTYEEVHTAVSVAKRAGNKKICLLHCISIYPAEIETINLNNIVSLREQYPEYPIGFSDHTLGTETACAAVALGAAVVEKHLTLDKSKIGMDNNMAVEPDEMALLVRACDNVQKAIGSRERIVSDAEKTQLKKMRRSIIATRDLHTGETINRDDLDAKRPGDGIPPSEMEKITGEKLLHDVEADCLITYDDIE